jgi:hypothetical protein
MSSVRQQETLVSWGFSLPYAQSLPNRHAKELIQQLWRISNLYYHGNLTRLSVDVKEAVARKDIGNAETARLVGELDKMSTGVSNG